MYPPLALPCQHDPQYPSIGNLEEDLEMVGNIQPTPQCLVTQPRLLGELDFLA